jgi:hypothetical protein
MHKYGDHSIEENGAHGSADGCINILAHVIQHNDTQHNDTEHNDTQHNDNLHNNK